MRGFTDISIDQLAAVSGGQIGAAVGSAAEAALRWAQQQQPRPQPAEQLSPIRPGMSGLAIRERLPAVP